MGNRWHVMLPETFETLRLLLRPIAVANADAIFEAYAQDDAVARYVIWRPHRSRSETYAYVEHCIAMPVEVERTYVLVGLARTISSGCVRAAPAGSAPYRLRVCACTPLAGALKASMDRSPHQGCGLGLAPALRFPHRRRL